MSDESIESGGSRAFREVRAQLSAGMQDFIDIVSADYAKHPKMSGLPFEDQRRIAELVRAPWRAGGPQMQNIVEAHEPETGVRVRVYDPGGPAAKPALIYLHGGGWTFFSLETHDRLMREYAARAQIVVIGVDYALSPEAKFPVALRQATAVVLWLNRSGLNLGVQPDRLAIGGDSAGANLAMAASLLVRDAGKPDVLCALLLNYGVFHMFNSDEAERRFGGGAFMLNRDEMQTFWANYLTHAQEESNPLACPALADLRGLPPAFMTIPECDILSEQSVSLANQLKAAGVSVRAQLYPGATHSFLEAVSIAPVADRALHDGAVWLRTTLFRGLDGTVGPASAVRGV